MPQSEAGGHFGFKGFITEVNLRLLGKLAIDFSLSNLRFEVRVDSCLSTFFFQKSSGF